MRALRTGAVVAAVLLATGARAQEFRYELEVEGVGCDGRVATPPGATAVRVPVIVTVDASVAGAQGFVMGIRSDASDVVFGVDPCDLSCASQIVAPGGRGDEVFFSLSTVVDARHVPTEGPLVSTGPQGPGLAVSIALNVRPLFLLGAGRTHLTRFWVEVPRPDPGEERTVRLSFQDGLQIVTSQGPVRPIVNQLGVKLKPDENAVTSFPELGECSFTVGPGRGGARPGDFTLDDSIDLADAVVLLHHLALGNPPAPPCEGTVFGPANVRLLDSNGDDYVDISDAIYLLSHLFLGTPHHVLGRACTEMEGCPAVCE